MSFDLNSIKKSEGVKAPRIMVYGVEGIGKSTFAAGADTPIFIQTEDGLGSIKVDHFPMVESAENVMEAVASLYRQEHGFKTVVIDSLDWLETLFWRDIEKKYDAIYSGTKAALVEWGNALRMELDGTGVFVSTICPGYVMGVGMFARFGIEPPFLIGSCTPEQVAAATLRAIKRNHPEVIVNSRPLRPLLAVGQLFPAVADRMLRATGIPGFQKHKVGAGST